LAGVWLLLGNWLGISRLVVSNLFLLSHFHHLSVLGFISLSFCYLPFHYNLFFLLFLFHFISILKLFLSQPTSILTFALPVLFPPIPLGVEGASGSGV